MRTKFCTSCGQKLPEQSIFNTLSKGPKAYEFEDGWYCEECAISKVKKARQ